MKTIKQIADEIGVSKQAIRNQIEKLSLQSTLQKKGNTFAINEKQEKLIKNGFIDNKLEKSQSETQSALQSEMQSALRLIEEQNSQLYKELEIKNQQIEDLSSALVSAQKAAATAQALHAGTIQKQLQESEAEKEEVEIIEEKTTFWQRVFGKR